ncbi:hypothetical protein K474DRAFT_1585163 [Panus rudis PR-1116 ss-1]|nr:hypothetical protein K474DRAFT_1585163 [Panus rudis PR-1116 ss-1]
MNFGSQPFVTRDGLNTESDDDEPWYPWRSKETCVLDILRHVPRCAFSEKQNAVIHWAMRALGVSDIPSESTMRNIDTKLQTLCGIDSLRFKGALGHVYYSNDLAALIAQEMANPLVRPHLQFLPEDSGSYLSEAWQATRWLRELIPQLGTQMVRYHNQDYYVLEPTLIQSAHGQPEACIPLRWFQRQGHIYASAYKLIPHHEANGWLVDTRNTCEIAESSLILPLPLFRNCFRQYALLDPTRILGMHSRCLDSTGGIGPWTLTNPSQGNPWRTKAKGCRVMAFPIWLYCDDTSGNVSKRWNKHNSILFTAAGLPQRLVHKEYNVHFLATSNIAPPLEMLDGIVEQLRECQANGIWAWDCQYREWVLLIPSVLAILGDNPMQSEFACHIGMMGKYFCRVCWVSNSSHSPEHDVNQEDILGLDGDNDVGSARIPNRNHNDAQSEHEDSSVVSDSDISVDSEASESSNRLMHAVTGKRQRRKKVETLEGMIERLTAFMTVRLPGRLRTKPETLQYLYEQFEAATEIGGQTQVKKKMTETGIKDSYLLFFIQKLCKISCARGKSRAEKETELAATVSNLPRATADSESQIFSPVWRIRDIDPHRDTPVEILHTVLLGFVKYLWRDSVNRIPLRAKLGSTNARQVLMARLSSCDVSGLRTSPLLGPTLVNYARSLTGRDFRALVQVAPFVLNGLPGISQELIDTWVALGSLTRLIWQPEIHNLNEYITSLEKAINYFLDRSCALTPRWFNKPKFHILLHLPDHIRRFGPAILFATEGFESFNAVIRAHSIHSNRQSPSRDIAYSMARQNRTRHLLSEGYFPVNLCPSSLLNNATCNPESSPRSAGGRSDHNNVISPWIRLTSQQDLYRVRMRRAGADVFSLLDATAFREELLGFDMLDFNPDGAVTRKLNVKGELQWKVTISDSTDVCEVDGWIVYQSDPELRERSPRKIGRVLEILQLEGSTSAHMGKADWILVQNCTLSGNSSALQMPTVLLEDSFSLLAVKQAMCVINIQHNCIARHCPVDRIQAVIQERERTSERSLGVAHRLLRSGNRPQEEHDWIINTSQMSNAHLLQQFMPPIPKLNRERIIHDSAKKETDRAKQNKQRENRVPGPRERASNLHAARDSRVAITQQRPPNFVSRDLGVATSQNNPTGNSQYQFSPSHVRYHAFNPSPLRMSISEQDSMSNTIRAPFTHTGHHISSPVPDGQTQDWDRHSYGGSVQPNQGGTHIFSAPSIPRELEPAPQTVYESCGPRADGPRAAAGTREVRHEQYHWGG